MSPERRSVVAFAGRRIDAAGAQPPRFPLERVEAVRDGLRHLLIDAGASAIVASAACGADLIALQLAEELGLRARIVLPFAPERFRESSVTDRPGDWGPAFDAVVARARTAGDLVVLGHDPGSGDAAYAATNGALLDEAQRLARERGETPLAVIAWEGRSRGPDDLTEAFSRQARARAIPVQVQLTVAGD